MKKYLSIAFLSIAFLGMSANAQNLQDFDVSGLKIGMQYSESIMPYRYVLSDRRDRMGSGAVLLCKISFLA